MFEKISLPVICRKLGSIMRLPLLTLSSAAVVVSLSQFALAEASNLGSPSIEEISKVYTNEDLSSLASINSTSNSPLYQIRGRAEKLDTHTEVVSAYGAGAAHSEDSHADAHGDDHSGGHHKASVGSLFWPGLNFVLYVLIMVWAYKKVGKAKLAEGAACIRAELVQAATLLGEAESVHGKLQTEMANIEEGKRELKEQLLSEGKKVAAATIEKAKVSASNAGKESERRVQSELAKANAGISTMLASRATNLAREQLRGSVVAEDDVRLRAQALELL